MSQWITLKRSTWQILLLCVGVAVVVGLAQSVRFQPLLRQELASLDLRFRLRGTLPAPSEIVMLAIDQQSMVADTFTAEELAANPELAALKNYPFPRHVYADAVEKLRAAGAKVIAFDLLFLSPKDGDEQLRAAIAKHRDHVVLAANFSDDGRQLMLPLVVVPESVPTASVAGFVNFWPDVDGSVRRMRWRVYESVIAGVPLEGDETELESFGFKAASKLGSFYFPIQDWRGDNYIRFYGPHDTFPTHRFYEIFYDKAWKQNLGGGTAFRDKIVLIGPTGNFQHDRHPTPFGPMDGVEIHANAIATLLHGHKPNDATWPWPFTLALLALATAVVLIRLPHPLFKALALTALGMAYCAWAGLAFKHWDVVLSVAAPLWTIAGGGVLGMAAQLLAEQLEKRRVRRTLDRYVSKQVAEEILRHGDEFAASLGGQRRNVTILFSDIRGFTTISEQSSPVELVAQLNEYLTAMVDAVMKFDGTLDKFVGDAIMTVYGAPTSTGATEDAWRAVQTAAEMRSRLAQLQQQWRAAGKPELRIGIGLNHGEVVVGNIGSPQRMEYTVIGDPVNVASRVEGLNKDFGTDILLTESVYELVKDCVEVELIGDVSVKGRAQKINVYALERLRI